MLAQFRQQAGMLWRVPAGRLIAGCAATGAVVLAILLWLVIAGSPQQAVREVTIHWDTPSVEATPLTVPAMGAGGSLPPAPDPSLIEQTADGALPTVAPDGRAAWRIYARPFDAASSRPRLAVVLTNLGTSASATENAIRNLPGGITLSFMPYRKRLSDWIVLARDAGHEVLLDLPMEPADAARADPGPNALRTGLEPASNVGRVDWMLARTTSYVGMIGFMGGRFEADRTFLLPVLHELKTRGLLYIDNQESPQSVAPLLAADLGLPFAMVTQRLDADPSRAGLGRALDELEATSRQKSGAIGLAEASPAMIEALSAWTAQLPSRGVDLAPVSALALPGGIATPPEAAKAGVSAEPAGSGAEPPAAVAVPPPKG